MATPPRIRLSDEALKEITRRSTSDELADTWSQYLLLLTVASSILDQAPKTIGECEALDVVERLGNDMEAMTTLIHRLFPGGLKEAWHNYLPERMRETQP